MSCYCLHDGLLQRPQTILAEVLTEAAPELCFAVLSLSDAGRLCVSL